MYKFLKHNIITILIINSTCRPLLSSPVARVASDSQRHGNVTAGCVGRNAETNLFALAPASLLPRAVMYLLINGDL